MANQSIDLRINEVLDTIPDLLSFLKDLNTQNITTAITGSSSLYFHGNFGRKPNDLDIYTKQEDLNLISKTYEREVITKNFPPVSWIQLTEEENSPHVLANLAVDLDDKLYNFSLTDLVVSNFTTVNYKGIVVHIVPPEEVLLLKLLAPRKSDTKDDLADIKNYLENNPLNRAYFDSRAGEIGITEIVTPKLVDLNIL
jgi:predicted nucleotidyltransferase